MKKKMFIWLDDERPIRNSIVRSIGYPEICDILMCKTGEHCIQWLEKHANEYCIWIAFDHDLGTGITGYDVAKYIIENEIAIEGFSCHSMNPAGRKNIEDLMKHYGYKEFWNLTKEICYG